MTAKLKQPFRRWSLATVLVGTAMLGGCAADGSLIDTGSITPPPTPTVAAVDPQCAALAQQIEQLKSDGTVGRLEKVAEGKGKTAVVKRNALVQQTQLNKANADYIAKCGPGAAKTASAKPVVSTAAPGASGVTVASSAAEPAASKSE